MKWLQWHRRYHVSYLIAWAAVGVLAGLAIGSVVWISAWWLMTLLLMVLAVRWMNWLAVTLVIFIGMIIGAQRGSDFQRQLQPYRQLVGQSIVVQGVIKDDPDYGKRGEQRYRITRVSLQGRQLPGDVYVTMMSIADVKRGDTVELRGKVAKGFGNYQATLWFASLVRAERHDDPVRELRDNFAAGVRNAVSEPAASLGVGFVTGQRSALPPELDEQLKMVGLTHVVVASGYNLTILVRFARRLWMKHSKYLTTLSSAVLMAGFVMVSGLSPSMTRAALVSGLSLAAWYYGRVFHPVILIVLCAALTGYANPVFVWADIGWYLSFLAFAGILIVAPLVTRLLWRRAEPGPLMQIVVETMAAEIMTLPIILFTFGTLPALGLVANMVVAPLIPFAMLLTAIAGVIGWIAPSVAGWVGAPATAVLEYTVHVVQWLASFHLQYSWQPSWQIMVGMYVAIALGCVVLWRWLRYDFRGSSIID